MRKRTAGESIGAILAGGRNRRFGSPKAFAEFGGRPLIERVLAAQQAAFSRLVIVSSDPAVAAIVGVTAIPDVFPGMGPAAGIHAALTWARDNGAEGICCSPCDAPFLHPQFFSLLMSLTGSADAVIPRSRGPLGLEPLFGWYSIRTVPRLEEMLESGDAAMHLFLRRLETVHYLGIEEVESLGGADLLYTNINTATDLAEARALLRISEYGS